MKKTFTEELRGLQEAYEETINTPVDEAKIHRSNIKRKFPEDKKARPVGRDKPISASTLKWADKRRKDIEISVKDLKDALSSGDKNALGATLMTMKSLIQVIEQGLKL